MGKSSFDSTESARPAFTRREIETLNKRYFAEVLEAYSAVRQLPVITAYQIDDEVPPSKTLNAQGIHFCIDIENAVNAALNGLPELQDAFVRMIDGQAVDDRIQRRVESTVGRVFKARQLDPGAYFRRVRRGRGEPLTRRASNG